MKVRNLSILISCIKKVKYNDFLVIFFLKFDIKKTHILSISK